MFVKSRLGLKQLNLVCGLLDLFVMVDSLHYESKQCLGVGMFPANTFTLFSRPTTKYYVVLSLILKYFLVSKMKVAGLNYNWFQIFPPEMFSKCQNLPIAQKKIDENFPNRRFNLSNSQFPLKNVGLESRW